jgi:hypothetical protein
MGSTKAGRTRLAAVVVLFVVGGMTYNQSQHIVDWARLRGYQPPAAVVTVADQTTMTPAARHLFYLNRPALQDKKDFHASCPNYEATIIIGCYRQGQRGIFVLKVDDPRLAGVEQVTAAHEMLHAVYNRLSRGDRAAIDGWLRSYANQQLSDARIKSTLQSYLKNEPGEQDNEMFAIFGTEVGRLPAELEQQYSKYFANRSVVVGYANNYQAAFSSRQDQVKQYDSQLNTLNDQIKANTNALSSQRQQLAALESKLTQYQQSGQVGRYNAGADDYNRSVAVYNDLLVLTQSQITGYNQMVKKRNGIAAQTVELRQAIDSSALPDKP